MKEAYFKAEEHCFWSFKDHTFNAEDGSCWPEQEKYSYSKMPIGWGEEICEEFCLWETDTYLRSLKIFEKSAYLVLAATLKLALILFSFEFCHIFNRKEPSSAFSLVAYVIEKVIMFDLYVQSSQRPKMVSEI